MKLYEKIRHFRKGVLRLSLKEFHAKLVSIFGDDALTYASLCRLEKGHREDIRMRTLYQISTGFGISLKELKEGTEKEESKIVTILKAADRENNLYIYNKKARSEMLTPKASSFLVMELDIEPAGATREEQDPIDAARYEKSVTALQGEIIVFVGRERHLIRRNDSIYFASSIPHHFENPSNKVKARCIIVQNPKSY